MGHKMPDSFEYGGLWWLPENPEKPIHGKLTYERGKRTILSLDGAFQEEEDFYEVILGDSYGKRITLINCLRTEFEEIFIEGSGKYERSEFVISIFFVGYHFAKKEDIKFTRLHVRYSELEEWLGERPFRFERRENEEGLSEHTLRFTMPKVKEINLEGFKIRIGYGVTQGGDRWRKPKFETNAGVSIEVSDEMHVDEFLSIAYHIKSFLTLGTGNEVSMLTVSGQKEETDGTVEIFYNVSERIPVEKLFPPPFFPFGYKAISERPKFYLQNWFRIAENIEPTYDLFFGTIYNPYLYPNNEFLSLAQALESYCSRTFDNNIMPNDLFEELLSQMLEIISGIPQEYRLQFEPKVKYGMNRKSLRTKLKELFEKYSDLFKLFVDDRDGFIGKVVDTRNYYTHYSPELEERAAELTEIPFLSQDLRFILFVVLLKEIGFDDKSTEQALTRYMRFRIRRAIA
jgi:hypothetical protein